MTTATKHKEVKARVDSVLDVDVSAARGVWEERTLTGAEKLKIEEVLGQTGSVYVSITGLRVKRFWQEVMFLFHALGSFFQSKRADGNLLSENKVIDGVKHTLTVWTTKRAMQKFIYSGRHAKAIKAFHSFASGETYGYVSEHVPTWEEALARWKECGKPY